MKTWLPNTNVTMPVFLGVGIFSILLAGTSVLIRVIVNRKQPFRRHIDDGMLPSKGEIMHAR